MFPNARLRVSWDLLTADDPDNIPRGPDEAVSALRNDEALGIYTAPTANWSKVLHALDSDVYLNYRARFSGTYTLTIAAEEGSVKTHQQSRWREPGNIRTLDAPPLTVAWPKLLRSPSVTVYTILRMIMQLRTKTELNLNPMILPSLHNNIVTISGH